MEPTQCNKIGYSSAKAESRKPTQCIKIACIKIWSRKPSQCIKIGNACIKIGMHVLRYAKAFGNV